MKIIPTIFAQNKKEFDERFKKILPVSKKIQIDFMDGKFVSSKSLTPSQIPNLKKFKKDFEAHLMTKNPEKYFSILKNKGFKKIIFHLEAVEKENVFLLTEKIRKMKLSCFLATNPETPMEKVLPFLKFVEGILFMGVHPGKEHQKLISSIPKKIQEIRNFNNKIPIQIDGGVNEKTAPILFKAGANILNSGSFISDAENPKDALRKLNSSITKY